MRIDPRPASPGRLALLAALLAALAACGGGSSNGPGPFDELLFVTDTLTVASLSVQGGEATLRDTAEIPGIPGSYTRAGSTVTVTIPHHSVPDGYWVDLDFSPGTGGSATDGIYVATRVDNDTFTITDPGSGTITGGTLLQRPIVDRGTTYVQAGTVITVTLGQHGLDTGDVVTLLFSTGAAVDGEFEVENVPDADTFTVVAASSVNTSGAVDVLIGTDYTIFGMAMHPSGRWLYVTSTYGYDGGAYQWGSDLISRFAIDWDNGHLTFERSFRTSITTPTNEPAPVTLAFSPDGTRMVNQDDDLDGLRLWSVDTVTGDLVQVADSGVNTTGQHGIVWSSNGSRLYHGTRVYTIGASSITYGGTGQAGEANQILNGTMFAIFGGSGGDIRAFDLTDPDAPSEIAASDDTPHHARDFVLLNNGALIVSSGFGGLKSYEFTGTTIVPAVGAGSTEFRDGGAPFPPSPNGEVVRVYRTISANAAGDVVAAAYFTNDSDAGFGHPPSGFILVGVAADGTLTLLNDYPEADYARVARFYQRP